MTEYYRKLDTVAQSRYLEKLKLLGLEEKDDPYEASNSCNFIDDMTKWPLVEYGRIFCYYIQRPGVYTTWSRRQLILGSLQLLREWPCEADQGLDALQLGGCCRVLCYISSFSQDNSMQG